MMRILISVLSLLILANCVQHAENNHDIVSEQAESERVEVKYAEGFDVVYEDGAVKIVTQSFGGNAQFKDSLYILFEENEEFEPNLKVIQQGKTRLACLSSTHLSFLNQLDKLNEVVGLCGIKYVNNTEIKKVLEKNKVVELCLTDQIQNENLYQVNPDLFLIYPFGSEENQLYNERGIQTLLIAEYLEKSQLARLEWIKLFGILTGRTKEANNYFDNVEHEYLQLKSAAEQTEKTFIMNLPFQDQWFMPAAKSVGVELIEDAGLSYYYQNEKGTENITHANEQVWNDGIYADYWVIIARRLADFTLDDLINESPVYKEFKSVKNHQVIFCNTEQTDYFSNGVIQPHIILKDLCYALGQIDDHDPQYFFLLD